MTKFQFCFFALLIVLGFTGIFKRAFEVVCEKIKKMDLSFPKMEMYSRFFVEVLLVVLFWALIRYPRNSYVGVGFVGGALFMEVFCRRIIKLKFSKKNDKLLED